jgi:hypothetical protein
LAKFKNLAHFPKIPFNYSKKIYLIKMCPFHLINFVHN